MHKQTQQFQNTSLQIIHYNIGFQPLLTSSLRTLLSIFSEKKNFVPISHRYTACYMPRRSPLSRLLSPDTCQSARTEGILNRRVVEEATMIVWQGMVFQNGIWCPRLTHLMMPPGENPIAVNKYYYYYYYYYYYLSLRVQQPSRETASYLTNSH